ncbi:nucleotide sugar dehydrogenase [Halosimplex rubrum]|uniref:UDP-N-acetyl-D-mannosamine dehydrogenase n=1 Tax=Halosimplex rubrum TaxID=869889 RepID=A0A7D5T5H1_9EURY|nr:nucleotide sugar dehydrogenase [Halosimplex rubrum]QLH76895.1 nucleotide sugar dehydrogenase [Halosimplex rubrum]
MDGKICVIGLGYVGLPLAIHFDRAGHTVIGYDVDQQKIESLQRGTDPTAELRDELVEESQISYTADETAIEESEYIIVTVPTPVDDLKNPNLKFVESAGETIGQNIQEGATVILESTVYPGATREILAPAIERTSGFTVGEDFYVGYSPERMVPGDSQHGLRDVIKIVSGQNDDVLADLAALYETIVDAGVHRAPDIEAAEAAKCIENIQRDLNIALVNELAIACNNLGLDTHAVLEAAGTKWNFHDYQPGLVGGHCIPVDPFFMIYESERNGYTPQLMEQAREVNEYMPKHVAEMMLRGLNDCGKVLQDSTVLVLGLAYKPGVGDIRTSPVEDTIEKLQSYDVEVIGHDPRADAQIVRDRFGIEVQDIPSFDGVDAILLATPHEEYLDLEYTDLMHRMSENPLVIDVMGDLNGRLADSDSVDYRRV